MRSRVCVQKVSAGKERRVERERYAASLRSEYLLTKDRNNHDDGRYPEDWDHKYPRLVSPVATPLYYLHAGRFA